MSEDTQQQDDEISLIDLFAVLWRRKKMIITIVVIAMIGVIVFSVLSLLLPTEKSPLPNKFTPKALMLINNDRSSSGGSLSSMLSSNSGLSSLAGLMGVSANGSTYSDLAIYLINTNSIQDAVTDKFDLVNRYEIKKFPRAASRKKLEKLLKAETDEKSGVLMLSFTDTDPVFAQEVVNFTVARLQNRFDEMGLDKNKLEKENLERNIDNTFKEIQKLESDAQNLERSASMGIMGNISSIGLESSRINLELDAQRQVYTQLKIQYELIKVTMASESPVFQVLEYAEVPDMKSGPSRGLLCIIVTFAAGFLAVFLAFVLNALDNIKKDPEAMAKLKGINK